MELKDIVKNFVVSHFDLMDDFFNVAWDFVDNNYYKIRENIISDKGKIDRTIIPLSFAGKTEEQTIKAILIFTTGFKEAKLTNDITGSILASVQNACKQYMTSAVLTKEILQTIKSSKEEIINILKKEQEKEKPGSEKEKLEYELLLSGRKNKLVPDEEVEKTRERKRKEKNELFIDDERKEVFFNNKFIDKFQGQMYSILRHFVLNRGIGGDKDTIYKEVWGDYTGSASEENISGAIDTAITRFRELLKENEICNVVFRSEGVYTSKKIYVLEPTPQYSILRKIKPD